MKSFDFLDHWFSFDSCDLTKDKVYVIDVILDYLPSIEIANERYIDIHPSFPRGGKPIVRVSVRQCDQFNETGKVTTLHCRSVLGIDVNRIFSPTHPLVF